MITYGTILDPWVKPGLLELRHVAGARVLMELAYGQAADSRAIHDWLLLALLLKTPDDQHTCLNLTEMDSYQPIEDEGHEWPRLPLNSVDEWKAAVEGMPELICVVDGDHPIDRPIVAAGSRLYLARMYGDEVFVAQTLTALDQTQRLKVLFGGPGSGKTTKTAEDLVRLLADQSEGYKVELAAPTGKAAKRMSQVIKTKIKDLKNDSVSEAQIARATELLRPVKSKTIHKLLKFNPVADDRYRVNASNPLDCDLLIIDESSMMSLDMLVHVLLALPERATLWLVGDPDQLASVGAGTVFADVRAAASAKKLTNHQHLPGNNRATDQATRELIAIVQGMASDRSRSDAEIGASTEKFLAVLKEKAQDGILEWIDTDLPDAAPRVSKLVEDVISVAKRRIEVAESPDAVRSLGAEFSSPDSVLDQQVLCVHHRGILGVQSINRRIRQSLGSKALQTWFVGMPVLISRNESRTDLYNGDTGVIAEVDDERVLVLSDPPDPDYPLDLRCVEVSRVADHSLNFAMTVHKSQGSEYRHVIVMFPQNPSRICTREMLYTAISRVRDRVTIVGSERVIRHMLATPIRRASGLTDRF